MTQAKKVIDFDISRITSENIKTEEDKLIEVVDKYQSEEWDNLGLDNLHALKEISKDRLGMYLKFAASFPKLSSIISTTDIRRQEIYSGLDTQRRLLTYLLIAKNYNLTATGKLEKRFGSKNFFAEISNTDTTTTGRCLEEMCKSYKGHLFQKLREPRHYNEAPGSIFYTLTDTGTKEIQRIYKDISKMGSEFVAIINDLDVLIKDTIKRFEEDYIIAELNPIIRPRNRKNYVDRITEKRYHIKGKAKSEAAHKIHRDLFNQYYDSELIKIAQKPL